MGAGVVFVDAGPRVLVVNNDGKRGLGRALQSARIPVDFQAAGKSPLSPDVLDRYRAVVVENVPASCSAACGWSTWPSTSRTWEAAFC